MSTRGAFGFYIDGQSKIAYNRSDSYPSELGVAIAHVVHEFNKGPGWRALIPYARGLRVLKEKELALKTVPDVALVTIMQKCKPPLSEALLLGYIYGDLGFLSDSLFCEHAYVLNLDDGLFEYYEGFQHNAHEKGRYACNVLQPEHRTKQYYPVALTKTFSLDRMPVDIAAAIPESDIEELVRGAQETP